jgi:hypothetical protein
MLKAERRDIGWEYCAYVSCRIPRDPGADVKMQKTPTYLYVRNLFGTTKMKYSTKTLNLCIPFPRIQTMTHDGLI